MVDYYYYKCGNEYLNQSGKKHEIFKQHNHNEIAQFFIIKVWIILEDKLWFYIFTQ